ncbi:exocyst complex component 3 [Acyrthosiphon pisum]|uniref:Exocyst complex component 3 n=1 Tax=Acyrthosiphon pisum TaxID=7029 RepID=A0A8R2NW80_ACYPI|nr:exocyst complex component 3 [Acyrthosiphon pisum]XP_003247006.1 exocyst complex component 3 [Acyrthosiphon pisum]XP_029347023.1 exocyst complex component 3 [Acyrthosiphon pisum]XP_029347025.1 exocyst complex component 3 [Acyrthosiphon pisum]|eukprot:XP_001950356.1 PREDICTED: exocyst complex component 3 [Acyrthosiphon pisum]
MDIDQLGNDAKLAATKYFTNTLKNPGQLEKVEQLKNRISRKKTSTEAMLKTAMQSQLDGVTIGMEQLKDALDDISKVKIYLSQTKHSFINLPSLGYKLQDVRTKQMQHSQYLTANENMKHLFTVPESIEKTKQWINDGKFLHAHQCLIDLENSRDDLLFEVHKLPNQAPSDKILLKAYFEDVEVMSDMLKKQIKLVLSRTLNTVRKEPMVIVTVLRIIEREERADIFALQRHKQSGFMPPSRPKKWKEMAFDVLQKSVDQRIEGTQVNERSDNKMWLVTYLELCRQLILEDLRVVKTLCVPCFPPQYDIFDKFVYMYHSSLSANLNDIISDGLEGNEYVTIISWVTNTYSGTELMLHPELNIDIGKVGPLLKSSIIFDLQSKYLEYIKANYKEWMLKTLDTEKNDWYAGASPEVGPDGCFHTAAPVIIFQMIDQNLQVTKTISQHLTHKALLLSVDSVSLYGLSYKEAVIEFKKKHFEDRSKVPFFTHCIITVLNNCLQFIELALEMKQHYWSSDFKDQSSTAYEKLIKTFQNLRDEAAQFLLEEALIDLDIHFQDLITTKWLTSFISIETICVTLEDYFQDYTHLKPKNLEYIILEAEDIIVRRYIMAILQKKLNFKTYEERRSAADKMTNEVDQLKSFFMRVAPLVTREKDSPFDAVVKLSEVLKSEDSEILSLDLHTLVKMYPDITEDQMTRLLSLRGDLSRSEIREKVQYAIQGNRELAGTTLTKSIFQQIHL